MPNCKGSAEAAHFLKLSDGASNLDLKNNPGYAALEVSVTGNTRFDMPGCGEWDCEELETRLLEGALQNLQYFPQLIKEVQLQNQEKERKELLEEERRYMAKANAEKKRLQLEDERRRELKRKKEITLAHAVVLLKDDGIEQLRKSVEKVHEERAEQNLLNDKLETQIHFYQKHLEKLEGMQRKVEAFLETKSVKRLSNQSKTVCEQLIGIPTKSVCNVKNQEEFIELSRTVRQQQRDILTLEMKLESLEKEKSFMLNAKAPTTVTVVKEGHDERCIGDIKKQIEELHRNKLRLLSSIQLYSETPALFEIN
ncbi:calponin homology domain-containing protein DDB_G0272472-like [Watersipora subatra]|uniref:calponin homology domain-containing protein DDB_G0272472-like n=1 Tax=Watersipora subatra TaxID=2589382 RepID=UPI00355BE1A6